MPEVTNDFNTEFPGSRLESNQSGLWVAPSASAPATQEDPNDAAYTFVGLVTSRSLDLTNNLEEAQQTDYNSGGVADAAYSDQQTTFQVTVNVPKTDGTQEVDGDAGQKIMEAAAFDQGEVFWIDSTLVDGGRQRYARAKIEQWTETAENASFVQYNCTMRNVSTVGRTPYTSV